MSVPWELGVTRSGQEVYRRRFIGHRQEVLAHGVGRHPRVADAAARGVESEELSSAILAAVEAQAEAFVASLSGEERGFVAGMLDAGDREHLADMCEERGFVRSAARVLMLRHSPGMAGPYRAPIPDGE